MRPHSVTVERKSIWLEWAIIGYNRDEADSQERLRDLWTGNVCCSSQHFTASIFPARAAWLPQDNLHWCLTSFTQDSFALLEQKLLLGVRKKKTSLVDQPPCMDPYALVYHWTKSFFYFGKTSSISLFGWTLSSLQTCFLPSISGSAFDC